MAFKNSRKKDLRSGMLAASAAGIFGSGYLVGKKRAKTHSAYHRLMDSLSDKLDNMHD